MLKLAYQTKKMSDPLFVHMARNHVASKKPKTVKDAYAAVQWFLSRTVPPSCRRRIMIQYCDQAGIPRPWSGELKGGETEKTILGKKIRVQFLSEEGRLFYDVGEVIAVLPFSGIHTLFPDGPVLVTDEDEWDLV